MTVKKVERVGDRLRFTAQCEVQPKYSEVLGMQARAGYPAQGYGGPTRIYTADKRVDGVYETTWDCAASCD